MVGNFKAIDSSKLIFFEVNSPDLSICGLICFKSNAKKGSADDKLLNELLALVTERYPGLFVSIILESLMFGF